MLQEQVSRIKNSVNDILLLGFGGSHAYGTNVETSDIDLRGIYRNSIDELLGIYPDSEQFLDEEYDTVIYSLKKMTNLLCNCNPNTIELLGLRMEDYLILTEEGKLLVDNAEYFLSKKAIYTFGNYAKSQLNRLLNRSGNSKNEILSNEKRSVEKQLNHFKERYREFEDFKVDIKDGIYLSCNIKDLGMEKLSTLLNEVNLIHKDYKKSRRNDKAILHDKLNKHAMHLIRLYMMGIDILNGKGICTYRSGTDHELLMSIRNGDYLEEDNVTPTKEFKELVDDYSSKFEVASLNTKLSEKPDYEKINEIIKKINCNLFNSGVK